MATHFQSIKTNMAIYEVFSKTLKIRYKSPFWSQATLLFLVTGFLTMFLPFLVGYRSRGFWIKEASYREQPIVQFKNQFFLYLYTNNSNGPEIFTNMKNFISEEHCCYTIEANELDFNQDGKLDQLSVTLLIPQTQKVFYASVILVFDLILQAECKVQMETLGIIEGGPGVPITTFEFHGDLKLLQRSLLTCRRRHLKYNNIQFKETLDVNSVLNAYASRNISTRIEKNYVWWGTSEDSEFKIKITINYPEQIIKYRPGFWGIVKWAWIQYFSIFIIFYYLTRFIRGFIFDNRLLPTIVENPLKKYD